MSQAVKRPRRFTSHADCEHENTKSARKMCRLGHLHDDCDHEQTQHARAWCTRRKNKAAE